MESWVPRLLLSVFSGSGNLASASNVLAPQQRRIYFLPKDEPRTFGKRRAPIISQTEKRSHLQAAVTRGDGWSPRARLTRSSSTCEGFQTRLPSRGERGGKIDQVSDRSFVLGLLLTAETRARARALLDKSGGTKAN